VLAVAVMACLSVESVAFAWSPQAAIKIPQQHSSQLCRFGGLHSPSCLVHVAEEPRRGVSPSPDEIPEHHTVIFVCIVLACRCFFKCAKVQPATTDYFTVSALCPNPAAGLRRVVRGPAAVR
jgi:hypothetical protein